MDAACREFGHGYSDLVIVLHRLLVLHDLVVRHLGISSSDQHQVPRCPFPGKEQFCRLERQQNILLWLDHGDKAQQARILRNLQSISQSLCHRSAALDRSLIDAVPQHVYPVFRECGVHPGGECRPGI